jgi:hypothetical protein
MPLVVRMAPNGQYRLVSPCFVYGMMSGERWNPVEAKDIQLI